MTLYSDRICPGLYLGDLRALLALGQAEKEEQEQWCVITVLSKRELKNVALPRHIKKHLIIQAHDEPCIDLHSHFGTCHDFIKDAHGKNRDVLVHCMAGISRSATIVAAHLIKEHRITPKEAIAHMAMMRPQVGPNSGFRIQLETLSSQVNK